MPPTDPVAVAVPPTDLAELQDRYLRLAADFENYRRRSRLEAESRALEQKEALIAELLPVLDNLERALAAAPAHAADGFRQGVEMTLKLLQNVFRAHGVESDDIVGRPFDPHRHEALAQRNDPAQPDHVVLSVLQRGYRRGDKVVRPAKVTVNAHATAPDAPDGR